ncbi:MAG: class I SAM-dependent methyltransferase [Pyrinomonadaceae bacterium]|nr:class I SAM-dependent methyltransferase [Pyrinomonadaceae bacterium]
MQERDQENVEIARERVKEIQAEFAGRGDSLGWFEAFYKEAAGDIEKIPWADLQPNRFFKTWAERVGLDGKGRKALVVGCGLGDDARYLDELGFDVCAFDISATAIEWAKRLSEGRNIQYETMDLFEPVRSWLGAFDFVLEIYTIQPLPLEIRPKVIDAVANFVKDGGELVVVTRGREDDEEAAQVPWPLSRRDLSRFEANGLKQTHFEVMPGDEDPPIPRFLVVYG